MANEGPNNSATPPAVNVNNSSMNFSELGKQANAQLEITPLFKPEVKEETKVEPTTVEPVKTSENADQTQIDQPEVVSQQTESDTTQSDILSLPDNARLKVLVDGKEQVITVSDYKAGIQREAVFTKRMQTLAEQRKQVEQELAQQAAYLQQMAQQVMQEKQQVSQQTNPVAQLQKLIEQQQQQPQQDPNSIATIGEMKQMLADLQKQQQDALNGQKQEFMQTLEHANQELQQKQADARDAFKYSTALQQELGSDVAKVIQEQFLDPSEAEAFVRFNVAKMNPQSIDEAIQFTKQYVKGWADHIKAKNQTTSKVNEVKKANAMLEPSNGQSAPPIVVQTAQPQSFLNKDGKIDFKALAARANALLG